MRAVVLVVSDKEKDTSSTSGMETSRLTSLLLQHRASHIVEERLQQIETAYLQHDFQTFGQITMQDSNQFHAVCLDTYPPIFYMNDISKSIIKLIHVYNAYKGEICAAYTFDAGPNAVIYTLDQVTTNIIHYLLIIIFIYSHFTCHYDYYDYYL
jgi:diphosphomevalonate decarboxylase